METTAPSQGKKDTTKQIVLPSGATLHLGRPSYESARRLRQAMARTLANAGVPQDTIKMGIEEIKKNPQNSPALLQKLLGVLASDEVEAAIFECLVNSTYQPKGTPARIKIDHVLLDHEMFGDEARNDFFMMSYRAGEAALLPFFQPLVSLFQESLKKRGGAQESIPQSPKSAS